MAVIKVPTTFNIDVEFEIPEFYRRMIALIIDGLICFFYFKIASAIIASIRESSSFQDSDNDSYLNLWAIWLLFLMPVFLYHIVMEITMNGQSVGKKIMGMQVVNENGGKASISQFIIRWLLRDIWFVLMFTFAIYMAESGSRVEATFMIILVLGFFVTEIVLVVSTQKGQRLADILAHTILIKTNSRASIEETIFQEVADTYTPSFPQIMQLSDRDINAIKSILETAQRKGDFNMAASASDKIKSHLKIESSLSPFDFLDLLLKDYNYLSTK
jgi:uncharacterized RDD family membrane protein YckC